MSDHTGFIVAAYAFTALVMAALIGNAIRDRRAQVRALSALNRDERQ